MSRRLILPALLALGLGACATIPQELTGTYTTITPENATAVAPGTRVRWGGDIIQTEPQERATCFFVLGEPLDSQARPEHREQSRGRFVACKQGFYDPEVYAKGREITVTGTVSGSETRKVGDYDYAYPRVDADVVYLWPKRPMYAPSPYYDPFYGPFYDPFFGPFGPGFFPPPVIIVQPRTPPPPPPSKPSHH
jgi:outer membrane lipoprotein